MKFSSSQKFLMTGGDDGSVRLRPSKHIMRFSEFRLHDGDVGKITGVCASYDDRFLLTCGEDGQLNVFKVKAKEIEQLADLKVIIT